MIELIILGFLSYGYPFTLYDIKKGMERSTEFFASTSQGAIHPTLVKLEANGYIVSTQEKKNNRTRKLYLITEMGKEQFSRLMRQDLGQDKYRSMQLLKMLFFQELTKEERLESIQTQISHFREMNQTLHKIQREGEQRMAQRGLNFENCNPAKYEEDALEFGLNYSGFVVEWFEKYYKKMQEEV